MPRAYSAAVSFSAYDRSHPSPPQTPPTPRRQTPIFTITLRAIASRRPYDAIPCPSVRRGCWKSIRARTAYDGHRTRPVVAVSLFIRTRPPSAKTPWTRKRRNPGTYPCIMHTPTIMSFIILLENVEIVLCRWCNAMKKKKKQKNAIWKIGAGARYRPVNDRLLDVRLRRLQT